MANTSKQSSTFRPAGRRNYIMPVMAAALLGAIGVMTINLSRASSTASLLTPTNKINIYKDLRYSSATTSSANLLDLFTPDNGRPQTPLIVWVHGGGWDTGNKESKDDGCMPYTKGFVQRGFAVACINYRLTDEAIWPAQIIDVKSAVRYLRANAATYRIYPTKIGIWGDSAGGQLAAVAGTAANVQAFDKGANLGTSSSVQAVVDDFGISDLVKLVNYPLRGVYNRPDTAFSKLVGGPVLSKQALAATASPMTYINGDEPPFMIWHGKWDVLIPDDQSVILDAALKKRGISSQLTRVDYMNHADWKFYTADRLNNVSRFFDQILRP